MSDTATEDYLTSDKSQRTGTVGLPHCELELRLIGGPPPYVAVRSPQTGRRTTIYGFSLDSSYELVISYQSQGKAQGMKDESSGPRLREGTGSPLRSGAETRSLSSMLMDVPGIDKKETRDTLLAGLPVILRESLEPRPAATLPDLIHIVAELEQRPQLQDGTWPIDILIAHAIQLANGLKLEEELKWHRDKRCRDQPSIAMTPSLLDLQVV